MKLGIVPETECAGGADVEAVGEGIWDGLGTEDPAYFSVIGVTEKEARICTGTVVDPGTGFGGTTGWFTELPNDWVPDGWKGNNEG